VEPLDTTLFFHYSSPERVLEQDQGEYQAALRQRIRCRSPRLRYSHELEEMEPSLQQKMKEDLNKNALRSGTTWLEHEEANTRYFLGLWLRSSGNAWSRRTITQHLTPSLQQEQNTCKWLLTITRDCTRRIQWTRW
jgi:hypothetical protein